MKDHIFEELLRAERARPLPVCPSNLEANVLRRIRLAASETESVSVLDWLFGLLPQKSLVLSALALAVMFSVTSTVVLEASSARAAKKQSLAVSALDFGVFDEAPFFDLEN